MYFYGVLIQTSAHSHHFYASSRMPVFHMVFGNVGSTKYLPISLAALLFFIYPPVEAILNYAIAKKWPSLIKTISITVAFLGLAVMLGVDLKNLDLRGVVIGITAGIACAVNII